MAKTKILSRFWPKMLKNVSKLQNLHYLKITRLPITRARNVLEGSKLDQWYLLIVSRDVQRDF